MRKSLYSAFGVAFLGTPGKAPSGMFPAFFAPLLVEAGLAPAGGLVAGAVGGLVFGFFGAGSRPALHVAGHNAGTPWRKVLSLTPVCPPSFHFTS